MGTMTIRLPDDTHERLRDLAQRRKVSLNRLMEELSRKVEESLMRHAEELFFSGTTGFSKVRSRPNAVW